MIRIIRTGGKQYIVKPGATLNVEKLPVSHGSTVQLEVLLTADHEDTDNPHVEIGTPVLNTNSDAIVVSTIRTRKVAVVKFKRKVRYRRRTGHRQTMSRVTVA